MNATTSSILAAVLAIGALALPAPASASPPAGDGQFSTGPSCAVSCITSALIEPHTESFGLDVHTDTPARIFIGVQHLGQPEGSWVDWAMSEPGRTRWGNHLTGLQPDTTYKVTVSATDALSRTEKRTTYFRTLAVQTAVPVGPDDVQSGVGCSQQCISAVRLAPDGTGAGMTVDTTVPAKVKVSVDDDAPGTIDGAPFFGTPEGSFSSTQFAKRRAGFVDGLRPGSNYHIIVRATDAAGFTAYRQGIFRTKSRRAKLVLEGVRVYYDGDKGANRGELGFAPAVNQEYQSKLRIKEAKVASGNWLEFRGHGRLDLAPLSRGLNLAIQARERDHAPTCYDRSSSGLWSPDNGSVDKWCEKRTWVTVRQVIDLDAPVPGSDASPIEGGAGRHEFEIKTSNSAGIRFVVYGHVIVGYS
jgi:hypothetical protein